MTTITKLVDEPAFISAAYMETQGGLLSVYRSPLVDDESELYQPVKELLGSAKFWLDYEVEIEDPSMVFGRGILTVYVLEDEWV